MIEPNKNAELLPAAAVTEDNEHRTCGHCGAGVLAAGYVVNGGCEYYCTVECLRDGIGPADYADWRAKTEDPGEYDAALDWIYWTEWEDEA